ncbi:MAG: hypothetical protein JWM87_4686, partial [Candidatus Eremiobacteraeota bacterium]|nr:hypothetical protein [Candidatus Eremiobacteraeota bacterium]
LNVFLDKLTEEEGAQFLRSEGRARRQLLRNWYNDH